MTRALGRTLAALLLLAMAAIPPARAGEPLTLFAAASLAEAMDEILAAHEAATGAPVRASYAASSTLARQIEAGAPTDIFASANVRWMDHLAVRGLVDAATRVSPIANRLVLVAPAGTPGGEIAIGPGLDLAARMGPKTRLAVGDPDHVPAGLYAEQALASLGLWAELAPRLARADDVRAALALVARGETPFGIVYATDAAITPAVRVVGTFPADSHRPIVYPFAVVAGAARPAVADLFAFVTEDAALAIFEDFGFERN